MNTQTYSKKKKKQQDDVMNNPLLQNILSSNYTQNTSTDRQSGSSSQIESDKSTSPTDNLYSSSIPEATVMAIRGGANPVNLDYARQHLGDKDYVNLCERFVENAKGQNGIYGSAAIAWQDQQHKAVQGLNGIKPGDAIYFAPDQSNGGDGHTGIYSGNGNFVSATANGVKEMALGAWQKLTGQQILGYIPQGEKG